ncbi:hypothetical protein [Candidatus Uabimicrobium amorphum]|uniref:Uncharacterized protein n=1 Tax=Uabimicrobium amorphum TaxID=2596890 RepID=A0A5S9IKX3_UABAM|nr:hypothetical protein [Candidatus Uabimicrobium amorphum]BBM83336.1 hypothetical protein UABAM_01688 [Candidatus Uabimicrobium amorphum]
MTVVLKADQQEIIERQLQKLTCFLDGLGLPSDNVIADYQSRQFIGQNLPAYIQSLPNEIVTNARYLSKFVVGAGIGLFDYALNAIWNEVVLSLRKKAIAYGLDIFFDAAVGGNLRATYQSENDLAGLKDIVLLGTCKKLELITETVYKKLAHILDMRNSIGISHPTAQVVNSFELLGWLDTCIKDVLNDCPSESAIQVKAFIENLKNATEIVDNPTLGTIQLKITSLSSTHCCNILTTIFGMFVSNEASQVLRKNISFIAPIVWNCCPDQVKYKLGILLEGYKTNLHSSKHKKGVVFFEKCDGNRYRTPHERIVMLSELTDQLEEKHWELDNFYNEVPIIEKIMSYIKTSTDIPKEISYKMIKVLMLCRIGKGVSYHQGVSPVGKKHYDNFFSFLGENHIPILIKMFTDHAIKYRLDREICRDQAKDFLSIVNENVVMNERMEECLKYLENNIQKNANIVSGNKFKDLSKAIVDW